MTTSNRPTAAAPSRRGFTLIELLVVLAILGLLAAIIAPNMHQHWLDSQRQKAQVDLKTLLEAAQTWQLKHHAWPTLRELATPGADGSAAVTYHRDPWDNDYVLVAEPGRPLVVFSPGPDHLDNTEDDVLPPPPELPR